MKTLYTFCFSLLTVAAVAQVPTKFGTNAEDGILYQEYNLIDHGTVSSVRFQAQNAILAGDAEWSFFTGAYDPAWRPYTADDTISGYDAIIDPSIETASARFNTQALGGGQPGRLQAIQAGYYYTAIVQTGAGDNFMSIIETDFQPVVIDTVYITPTAPSATDDIVFSVELDGALTLSPGERVFIRAAASADFTIAPNFLEVTNFSNGVGTATIPAGSISPGIAAHYYALVTEEAVPVHETIDYFTLFFGNNSGTNYSFTVSTVTEIEEVISDYGIIQTTGLIAVNNAQGLTNVELIALDGKVVASEVVQGTSVYLSTSGLPTGLYILNMIGKSTNTSTKLFVH